MSWLMLAAVIGGLLLAACQPSRQERLAAEPEADLAYPSSELLGEGGRDGYDDIFGWQRAESYSLFGTTASVDEVHAFYDAQLLDDGWQRSSSAGTTGELEAHSWERDLIRFRLGFPKTDHWSTPEGAQDFPTIYEVQLNDQLEGNREYRPGSPFGLALPSIVVASIAIVVLGARWSSQLGRGACLGRFLIALGGGAVVGVFTFSIVWGRGGSLAILFEAPFFALVAFAVGFAVTLCVIGLVTYLYSRLSSRISA